MTVARILASKGRELTTVTRQSTLRDIVDVLAAKHIGALVVANADGRMIGIVSERDVVRAIANRGVDALEDPVSDHMTSEVVTASETDSVIEVAQRMSRGRFRHMPVLKNGELVGIVSVGDAIKYRLEQMEQEQLALRDYIATA
jgi:CBS domain-containing protein